MRFLIVLTVAAAVIAAPLNKRQRVVPAGEEGYAVQAKRQWGPGGGKLSAFFTVFVC